MEKFVFFFDEGIIFVRVIIFDRESNIYGIGQYEFFQYYLRLGWVEYNFEEIWDVQFRVIKDVIQSVRIELNQIVVIGVINQCEMMFVWDKDGKLFYNVIVWQCRRMVEMVEEIKCEYGMMIKEKIGFVFDVYFFVLKFKWFFDNVLGLREKVEKGEVMFGMVDIFFIYCFIGEYVMDYFNVLRMMFFNIKKFDWDDEFFEFFDIFESVLFEVREFSEVYGYIKKEFFGVEIFVSGDVGDQQVVFFGQVVFEVGMVKVIYGMGSFIFVNMDKMVFYLDNLFMMIVWGLNGRVSYVFEGSIFVIGVVVQWFRDGIKIIKYVFEIEEFVIKFESNEGVYFVFVFVGLGVFYWDQFVRGIIIGIMCGMGREYFVRVMFEVIVYFIRDVVDEMEKFVQIKEFCVDGGVIVNDFFMQFQVDILNRKVIRFVVKEIMVFGVVYFVGFVVDY